MPITIAQLTEYLISIGVPVPPSFIMQAWLDAIAVIQPCLDGAGYPASTQLLIYMYALGLFAVSSMDKYVSSQSAPSGASQSFRYKSLTDAYRSINAMLKTLDTSGCTSGVIPAEPGASAGLWVSTGGKCC
jgi:hypothetical protein